jgi:sensor histidine kinase YesM
MIEVEDNGCGAGAEILAGLNRRLLYKDDEQDGAYQRVGLINVVQRLRLTYGQDTRLSLHNLPQGGVSVSLYLPQGNHQVNLPEREGY